MLALGRTKDQSVTLFTQAGEAVEVKVLRIYKNHVQLGFRASREQFKIVRSELLDAAQRAALPETNS